MATAPDLASAKVLITVKTYPLPSSKYGELVCTAGLLEGKTWIRIYPIPLSFLTDDQKYPKYAWVELDLVRNRADFRPESYRPKQGLDEPISFTSRVGTANHWAARKTFVLREVFTSMRDLIRLSKGPEKESLATIKPREVVAFSTEATDREWKERWLAQSKQGRLFEIQDPTKAPGHPLIRKLPYDYFYEFLTEGDTRPRKMKIEDWEIGALFWSCLRRSSDERQANDLVRQRYFDDFVANKDLYLFVGTTKQYHNVAPNPFTIVGVFYPPRTSQLSLL
jgi:hypothetical protein